MERVSTFSYPPTSHQPFTSTQVQNNEESESTPMFNSLTWSQTSNLSNAVAQSKAIVNVVDEWQIG